jgi:hypothetical protein
VENAAITSAGIEMTVLRATHKTPPAGSIRTKKSG